MCLSGCCSWPLGLLLRLCQQKPPPAQALGLELPSQVGRTCGGHPKECWGGQGEVSPSPTLTKVPLHPGLLQHVVHVLSQLPWQRAGMGSEPCTRLHTLAYSTCPGRAGHKRQGGRTIPHPLRASSLGRVSASHYLRAGLKPCQSSYTMAVLPETSHAGGGCRQLHGQTDRQTDRLTTSRCSLPGGPVVACVLPFYPLIVPVRSVRSYRLSSPPVSRPDRDQRGCNTPGKSLSGSLRKGLNGCGSRKRAIRDL